MMKKILIADAGSTKTHWSLLTEETGTPVGISTAGINPAHDTPEAVAAKLRDLQNHEDFRRIDEIYFYGAGCATDALKQTLKDALKEALGAEKIVVESDLLGAAIALFGASDGIACILGTGSNTGLYSGGKIISKIPSLGFILGDEGGGVALGKVLLNGIFKRQLSPETISKFEREYNLSLDTLIEKVYRQPKPAPFIASFSPFLLENIGSEEIRNLLKNEFKDFFKKNILSYKDYEGYKVGFVGSIAYNFKDILIETASEYRLEISNIISQPIHGLEKHYLGK